MSRTKISLDQINQEDLENSEIFRCSYNSSHLVEDPLICQNCQQIVCQSCYLNGDKCPNCSSIIKESPKDFVQILLNMLNKFRLRCENLKKGCPEEILYENYRDHLKNCKFQKIPQNAENIDIMKPDSDFLCKKEEIKEEYAGLGWEKRILLENLDKPKRLANFFREEPLNLIDFDQNQNQNFGVIFREENKKIFPQEVPKININRFFLKNNDVTLNSIKESILIENPEEPQNGINVTRDFSSFKEPLPIGDQNSRKDNERAVQNINNAPDLPKSNTSIQNEDMERNESFNENQELYKKSIISSKEPNSFIKDVNCSIQSKNAAFENNKKDVNCSIQSKNAAFENNKKVSIEKHSSSGNVNNPQPQRNPHEELKNLLLNKITKSQNNEELLKILKIFVEKLETKLNLSKGLEIPNLIPAFPPKPNYQLEQKNNFQQGPELQYLISPSQFIPTYQQKVIYNPAIPTYQQKFIYNPANSSLSPYLNNSFLINQNNVPQLERKDSNANELKNLTDKDLLNLNDINFDNFTVEQLKTILKTRNISNGGYKEELIDKVKKYLEKIRIEGRKEIHGVEKKITKKHQVSLKKILRFLKKY